MRCKCAARILQDNYQMKLSNDDYKGSLKQLKWT